MKRSFNLPQLKKIIMYALRYDPSTLGLKTNDGGWVDITMLLYSLSKIEKYKKVTLNDLFHIGSTRTCNGEQICEIRGMYMRATYGVHISSDCNLKIEIPKRYLYYLVPMVEYETIKQEGIKVSGNGYTELTTCLDIIRKSASKRKCNIAVIKILAKDAAEEGHVEFYKKKKDIWISTYIPPEYIKINTIIPYIRK